MATPIPITIAVEDELSEMVVRVILKHAPRPFAVGPCLRRGGNAYLRRIVKGLNNAAAASPCLLVTDLDREQCAPVLIRRWLPVPLRANLVFRVAVCEVEAWLLADREGFAAFAAIRPEAIPQDVESIRDPKRLLVSLVRKSRRREIRNDLVPAARSTACVGPNWNGRLCQFVRTQWSLRAAMERADSLRRTVSAIYLFKPSWMSNDAQTAPERDPASG